MCMIYSEMIIKGYNSILKRSMYLSALSIVLCNSCLIVIYCNKVVTLVINVGSTICR